MKRRSLLLLIWCLSVLTLTAQNYTLKGQIDEIVHVNENFHLRYTVNSREGSNFVLGTLPGALDKIYGPSQSVSIRTSTINGHTTHSEEVTLTFILSATKTGKYVVPPAQITIGGKTIKSEPLTVQVIDSQSSRGADAGSSSSDNTSSPFFVVASATKRHVMEYEPLLLTYKVCWHPDLQVINLDNITLELQNVFMEAYNDTQQKSPKLETISGRQYVAVDWKQFVIYPQKSGKLDIPSMSLKGYIKQDMPLDPFDPFSATYREVTRQLTIPAVSIDVDPLPDRPTDFSGGVGRFELSATIDKTEIKENTPLTLTVTVKGVGNLNMLKEPVVPFPQSFDTYDTKSTDNFRLTSEGLNGQVSYEFVAVPQRKGSYVIPPARFTYYDLTSKAYKTLTTDSIHVEVLKGDGTTSAIHDYTGQDDVETLGKDIRFIKQGDSPLRRSGETFFASTPYLVYLLVLVLVFFSLFIIFRQRAIENADVVKSRGKNANKVATRRLHKAARLMHDGKAGEFYDEALRALWGYVSDRLNIPASQLSQDNISERLQERSVGEATIGQFLAAIDECEFERYAPGDPKGNMNKVYEKSMTAIESIESSIKKSRAKKSRALLPFIVLALAGSMTVVPSSAATKADGDQAYRDGDYQQAITLYEEVLTAGVSADVYYNLGNAYYRMDDMAHAILNYERALLLSPGDADIRFNLQMARSHTSDKIAPETEMFFVTWYRSLINLMSVDGWAYLSLVALALAIVLLLLYLFSRPLWLRKVGFFGGVFVLLFFLLGNLFGWQQKRALVNRDGAVIMSSEVLVKSTPADNGTDLFVLHAGTKVTVTDNTLPDWKEIRLPDGRKGWVFATDLENI